MNSSVISISEILNSADKITSAGFSAGYSFDEINAEEYFDELVENISTSGNIFSGILIMKKSGLSEDESEKKFYTIIDGIQRVTTICLFLKALCDSYKNTSDKNKQACEKIMKRYLFGVDNSSTKLDLISDEQNIYRKIILSIELDEIEAKNNLAFVYNKFLEKIQKETVSVNKLFNVVSKVQFMVVIAEKSEVPEREMYQALNNNKEKSQVNLISDFIAQKSEEAKKIWIEIQDHFGGREHNDLLFNFVQSFLSIQNEGKMLNKSAVYNNFRSYYTKMLNYRDDLAVMQNLQKYALFYKKILNVEFDNEAVRTQISILNSNNGKDAYAYLMEVLDDFESGHIGEDMFLNLLEMVNTFILKRQENPEIIDQIDFSELSQELNRMLILNDHPLTMNESKVTINEMNNLSTFGV